jgi:TolA-binding protein
MKKYLALVLFTILVIACSKTSDQDYFNQAQTLLKEKKTAEAIKAIETLIKEYPESKIAPKALVQLAGIYQNQMVEKLKPAESFNQAQKYFYQVYEKYPDSEEAPQSLFLSGFILANDLKDFDKATSHYNLFLSKYPSHSLAVSAKEELDNMGLSPEEILKRTETAKN